MHHTAKNFDHLLGNLPGLSEKQLKAHFGLYQGYVKKINEIEEKLKTVDLSSANYSYGEASELFRRRAVAYNGTYLHQHYFENLNGKPSQPMSPLRDQIDQHFGSMSRWEEEMKSGIMSGHG